jgi:hypothetical protein
LLDPRYQLPSYVSFEVTVNPPPEKGKLVISPKIGDSLDTIFNFAASNF